MEKIVSRFRSKLVKMIKDASSKYDDYSISPKIRQILLHWGYELWISVTGLTEKKYCKKQKKDILKKKLRSMIYKTKKQQKKSQRIDTKTCQKNEKTRLKIKEYQKKDINNWFRTKKKHYKINELCFCSVEKWVKRN